MIRWIVRLLALKYGVQLINRIFRGRSRVPPPRSSRTL